MNGLAPEEPAASAFFACPHGVGVYVTVQHRSVRVEFASPEADGSAESEDAIAMGALVAARAAFRRHRDALAPLFQVAEEERRRSTEE